MSIKYSVEISYKLEKELKVNQIEVMTRYMDIIKEIPEIVEKDRILETYLNVIEYGENLYGIKESDIDTWQKDPINRWKKNRVNAGTINENTVPTNISAYDKDRIIVRSKRGSSFGDIDDVVFPNKQMEKDFIKDVKEKHKVPKSSSEFSTEYFTKNYPIKEQQANKAIRFLRDKFELEYPNEGSADIDFTNARNNPFYIHFKIIDVEDEETNDRTLAPLMINDETVNYSHNKGNFVSKLRDRPVK
jgi:hypothetical protein